jgi:uncharacterized membrane protein YgcG
MSEPGEVPRSEGFRAGVRGPEDTVMREAGPARSPAAGGRTDGGGAAAADAAPGPAAEGTGADTPGNFDVGALQAIVRAMMTAGPMTVRASMPPPNIKVSRCESAVELREFMSDVESAALGFPEHFPTEAQLVNWAHTFLAPPLKDQVRDWLLTGPKTKAEFFTKLRAAAGSEENLADRAYKEWMFLKQGGRTVQQLRADVATAEVHMSPLDDGLKIATFRARLRPRLQAKLTRSGRAGCSYEKFVQEAIAAEGLLRELAKDLGEEQSGQGPRSRKRGRNGDGDGSGGSGSGVGNGVGSSSSGGGGGTSGDASGETTVQRPQKRARPPISSGKCFSCGQVGHKRAECPEPKKGKEEGASTQVAAAAGKGNGLGSG